MARKREAHNNLSLSLRAAAALEKAQRTAHGGAVLPGPGWDPAAAGQPGPAARPEMPVGAATPARGRKPLARVS